MGSTLKDVSNHLDIMHKANGEDEKFWKRISAINTMKDPFLSEPKSRSPN